MASLKPDPWNNCQKNMFIDHSDKLKKSGEGHHTGDVCRSVKTHKNRRVNMSHMALQDYTPV